MNEETSKEEKENVAEDDGDEVDGGGKKKKQRGLYVTSNQKHRLLLFVENHYEDLFERSSASDIVNRDKLWELLTIQLNSKGPSKDESGWRRCFICYKAATRSKFKSVQSGRITVDKLNVAELRIAKMCKMDTCGIDLDLMLSRSESFISDTVASSTSTLQDQHKNSLESSIATLNLPLISEMDYMKAMKSSRAVDIDVTASVGDPGNLLNNIIQTASSNENIELGCPSSLASDITYEIQDGSEKRALNIEDFDFSPEDIDGMDFENIIGIVSENSDANISSRDQNQKIDRAHATEAQKDKLVQLVGENYSALFGRISNKVNADLLKAKLRNQIMLNVNSMGPKKDVPSWKRCLSSLKDLTKKKITVARNHQRSNVHGKIATKINSREKELIKIFGIDILDGCGKLDEIGFNSGSQHKKKTIAERDDDDEPDYMTQPRSLCTNSTVNSSMVSGIESTTKQSTDLQPICSSTVTKSTANLVTASETNTQNASATNTQNAQSHSNQIPQPRYHYNNAVVTLDQLKEIYASRKLQKVPSTSNSCDTLINGVADRIVEDSAVQNTPTKLSQDNNKRKNTGSNAVNRTKSKKKRNDHSSPQQGNDLTIRPLDEQRPHRRGVEVHPNKFVKPRLTSKNSKTTSDEGGDTDSDDNEEVSNRRRFRFSKPLGVLAEESLSLQRENNSLLKKMLAEMRKPK